MPVRKSLLVFPLLFLGLFFTASAARAQDLKAEEIVAKHLASIGGPERLKELKNMMLLGTSQFESKLPQRQLAGKVAIVSDTANLLFISSFAAENYQFEKIGWFDGKIKIPFVNPGVRSPLGDFINENPNILKHGLFGGAMSLQWSLLKNNLKKGAVKAAGRKNVGERPAHVLEYFVEGSSGALSIRLFFDAETFRHLRTQYRETVADRIGNFGSFGRNNGFETELTEDFSDFKAFEGVTLPTAAKVHYVVMSSKGTYEYDWIFRVNDVKFNQTLKENFFNFD